MRGRVFAHITYLQNFASEDQNSVASQDSEMSFYTMAHNFCRKLRASQNEFYAEILTRSTADEILEMTNEGTP